MSRIDSTNPRQPYEQIADYFQAEIEANRLKPGDRLPPVRDIAAQFDVAIGTVNSAIKALKDAGLVMSWQGKGVFVRDPIAASIDSQSISDSAAYELIISRLDEIHTEVLGLTERVSELERQRPRKAR